MHNNYTYYEVHCTFTNYIYLVCVCVCAHVCLWSCVLKHVCGNRGQLVGAGSLSLSTHVALRG